jgi:two-component system chemotaxis sensor kinase CheA
VQQIGSSEVYRLRESLLPIVWLDRLLGLERCEAETRNGHYIAVLEADGCRYGLVVDDLVSPEEIVVKPLSVVLREIGVFSGATVLGNGTLALILDVGAAAARAGVKPIEEEMVDLKTMEVTTPEVREISLLVFEDRSRERTALPLSVVERIESVPMRQIEYAGGRAMLQYRGELLPLRDEGHLLVEMQAEPKDAMVTVLICGGVGGDRRLGFGMVVRQVLDVAEGTLLEGDRAVNGMDLALVKERVTVIQSESELSKTAGWREVA